MPKTTHNTNGTHLHLLIIPKQRRLLLLRPAAAAAAWCCTGFLHEGIDGRIAVHPALLQQR
jgi:hypothetical protein